MFEFPFGNIKWDLENNLFKIANKKQKPRYQGNISAKIINNSQN